MRRDVILERVYPHPPQAVWKALTDPKALSVWLMENDFQPRVGHRFRFRTKPRPGFDGAEPHKWRRDRRTAVISHDPHTTRGKA
jgi:uncharacterized protein YndB with AHSA1/START domain